MTTAGLVCVTRAIGLTATDLAELGGVTDRTARRWLTGFSLFPPEIVEALGALMHDMETVKAKMVADALASGVPIIRTYFTTAQLRAHMRDLPGRGKAAGFFAAAHQIAALHAYHELLDVHGLQAELRFVD